jgi:Poly(ADP-ribose) polymerase and DNA-Ligase Zn-finger region
MAETIEVAKTGRARCRSCRQAIEKGSLRFGEEQPSAFAEGMQWAWHHLACGAQKRPVQVRAALATFEGEVPSREELEGLLAEADKSPTVFPYAERASTGRSKCLHCREPIEKGALRIATEREVELGGAARASAGYLHPACANEFLGAEDLLGTVRSNSRGLDEADSVELDRRFAG